MIVREPIEAIFTLYEGLIVFEVRRYFGKGVAYDDLLQEAYLTVLKAYKNFDHQADTAKFSTYLVKAIRNNLSYMISRENKRRMKIIDIFILGEMCSGTELLSPYLDYEQFEDERLIFIWQKLNQSEKELLTLAYGYGYGDKDIAHILNQKSSTIQKRRNRLIKKIRKLIIV